MLTARGVVCSCAVLSLRFDSRRLHRKLLELHRTDRALPTLNRGDHFGEMALLPGAQGKPRTATVSAMTTVECLTLTRAAFRSITEASQEAHFYRSASYAPCSAVSSLGHESRVLADSWSI